MSHSTAVVIPCLGRQASLDRLLTELPDDVEIFVVDDGSQPALRAWRGQLLRHPRNRGYGAAQKTGYSAALDARAQRVLLLHGDGQYRTADVLALAAALDQADAAMGSRFLDPAQQQVPAWRRVGIKTLAAMANLRFGTAYSDLHNGARAWRAEILRTMPWQRFSDDYRFDHQCICALLAGGARLVERPVGMHYGPEVLSISFPRALRYGLCCSADLLRTH